MQIGVIGMGAIGSTFAGMLAHHGFEVLGTARGDGLAALQAEPLHVSGRWGTFSVDIPVDTTLSHQVDVAIVATKAQDAEAALLANRPAIADASILIVQNGLEAIDTAARVLGRTEHVFGGSSSIGAAYLTPGNVHVNVPNVTRIGQGSGPATPDAIALADLLNAALPVNAVDNFDGVLWTKLMVNHVNALPAMTGLSIQEVVADDALCRILTASMRETIVIAEQRHVHFEPVQGLTHEILSPMALGSIEDALNVPRALAADMGAEPNRGSTLQSILRHQRTEIDWINGAVLNAAHALGIEAPINERIVSMVHEVERNQRFFARADVIRAFSASIDNIPCV